MNVLVPLLVATTALRPFASMSPTGIRPQEGATVTLAAMPYTRTVTCGTYTLTGTYTGAAPTGWTASPSGASGSCTDLGAGSFSCAVDVDPDATGEGVETITVTGGATQPTVTIGFYVDGEHSCFLAQSVNGSYNVGLADLDAITTWENLGSSALDVTQPGAATLKPTFRTAIVGGQPVVRCDGGDNLAAATASDWTFLNDGTDWTVDYVKKNASQAATAHVVSTRPNSGLAFGAFFIDSQLNKVIGLVSNSATNVSATESTTTNGINIFSNVTHVLDDDGGAGVDLTAYLNGASVATGTRTGSYSSTAPSAGLTFCKPGGATGFQMTGDLFRVSIYQFALTATQRGINEAVDEWALGGTLPRPLAENTWLFVGDSLTAGFGGVTSWPSKLSADVPSNVTVSNVAVNAATASAIRDQWRGNKVIVPQKIFVLGGVNDIAVGTSAATTFGFLSTIYSEASALGVEVIAMPTLPFGNAPAWSAADQVQLELLEASIIADGNVDLIVNWYDLMGEPGTPEDLAAIYDNGDGVHPNEAGTTFMADTMATALGL